MGQLTEALIKYGRPFWSAIGDENAARVAGATQMGSDYLLGPEGSDAQRSFEVGRRAFKRGLRDVRYENPYGAFAAEMAGNILLGAGAGRALKVARILEELDKPFRVRPTQMPAGSSAAEGYPKRTRQQWQADLKYGKDQFNKLRAILKVTTCCQMCRIFMRQGSITGRPRLTRQGKMILRSFIGIRKETAACKWEKAHMAGRYIM